MTFWVQQDSVVDPRMDVCCPLIRNITQNVLHMFHDFFYCNVLIIGMDSMYGGRTICKMETDSM